MRKLHMQQCLGCHRTFQTYDIGRWFCSEACQTRKLIRDTPKGEPKGKPKVTEANCLWCGKIFTKDGPKKKYCGSICQIAASLKKVQKKVCPECEKTFETASKKTIYCSEECVELVRREREVQKGIERRQKAMEKGPKKSGRRRPLEVLDKIAEKRRLEEEWRSLQ